MEPVQRRKHTREELETYGRRILAYVRTELTLSLPFLSFALGMLFDVMDLSTQTLGTDMEAVRFNPLYLRNTFLQDPVRLNRNMLHMLFHCLFLHPSSASLKPDPDLWNISCDIAAEAVLDSVSCEPATRLPSDFRQEVYDTLTEEVGVLTAERIFRFLSEHPGQWDRFRLAAEFLSDDHGFWERLSDKEKNTPPAARDGAGDNDWDKTGKEVRAALQTMDKEASSESGMLLRLLQIEKSRRTDYREFLKRFALLREEVSIDPDSFDYGFYHYGMSLYGNMPLLEETEVRESMRVDELVIVLDTSASCQPVLVQQFLNETARLLFHRDAFFKNVDIHILACDEKVQEDTRIRSVEEMKKYADGFALKGGFGTDFRPAFAYVEELRKKQILTRVKGLMYFTYGFGIYPTKPTDYDTAFVFWKEEEYRDRDVPPWALKLYVTDDTVTLGENT